MLLKWKKKNKLKWREMEEMIGISRITLQVIVRNKSSDIKVSTAIKIKAITGLDPWQYLDGLEILRKIIKQNEKSKK